jgi:hypothetical protein
MWCLTSLQKGLTFNCCVGLIRVIRLERITRSSFRVTSVGEINNGTEAEYHATCTPAIDQKNLLIFIWSFDHCMVRTCDLGCSDETEGATQSCQWRDRTITCLEPWSTGGYTSLVGFTIAVSETKMIISTGERARCTKPRVVSLCRRREVRRAVC